MARPVDDLTDSLARRAMFKLLDRVRRRAASSCVEPGRDARLRADPLRAPGDRDASMCTTRTSTPRSARGSLGLAESYIDGEWDSDDLTSLVRVGARNMPAFDRARAAYRLAERPGPRDRRTAAHDEHRHKRRTSGHYDIGNELFTRFLDDDTLAYSSGDLHEPARHAGRRLSARSSTASAAGSRLRPATTSSRSAPAGAASRSTPPATTAAA